MGKEFIPEDWELHQEPIIKVIGVGGGGNNAVNHMYGLGIKDVDFVVSNTDAQALANSPVMTRLQLGASLTRGRGAGCNPEQGRQAALESVEAITKILSNNTEMVFITAGMGGGTGTGAAPVIAQVAKELGILTVGIVTLPFKDEGMAFIRRAANGIAELQKHVDSLLIINNQKLYEIYGELSVVDAFTKVDDILALAAKGIAEIITKPGHLNVDFADVRMVMKNSGIVVMGTGMASGEKRALNAVEQALTSPLLNDSDIAGARNILVNITAGDKNPLKMSELGQIMDYIRERAGNSENQKRGVVFDPKMGDAVSVTIIATGFEISTLPEIFAQAQPEPQTGNVRHTPSGFEVHSIGNDEKEESLLKGKKVSLDLFNESDVFTVKEQEQTVKPANVNTDHKPIKPYLKKDLAKVNDKEITYLENVPAYLRKNVTIENRPHSSLESKEISEHKLDEKEGEYSISPTNPYLNPITD